MSLASRVVLCRATRYNLDVTYTKFHNMSSFDILARLTREQGVRDVDLGLALITPLTESGSCTTFANLNGTASSMFRLVC